MSAAVCCRFQTNQTSFCQDSMVGVRIVGRETRRGKMVPAANERFSRIYRAHYPAVLAYCARRLDRSEAEDVANDVFIVLWRNIDTFDVEAPLPWLYRVAYGSIRNRWKTARRRFALARRLRGLSGPSFEPADTQLVRREEDGVVLAAIAKLRPIDQEVLRLSIWEDLSASEIAEAVECSVSAAEQRLHRAKRRLARSLSPHMPQTRPSPESAEKGGRAA
jgi:RNA polymerase sigma-70 factor, ECF subfamily